MKPTLLTTPNYRVIHGDARERLAELPAGSVHCCVTSPPYFGLRVYRAGDAEIGRERTVEEYLDSLMAVFGSAENPVGVWRVLRDDGLCWVNLGTSYAGGGRNYGNKIENTSAKHRTNIHSMAHVKPELPAGYKSGDLIDIPSLFAERMRREGWWLRATITWVKGISLADDYSGSCMPESAAASGTYWVRHKLRAAAQGKSENHADGQAGYRPDQPHPNNSIAREPASLADCPGCPKCSPNNGYVLKRGSGRPTNATETVLMFAKTDSYYYDSLAVREHVSPVSIKRVRHPFHPTKVAERSVNCDGDMSRFVDLSGRCLRNAWWLPLENHTDAWFLSPGKGNSDVHGKHFALFPVALPELCIRQSTSERGVCPVCGAPWARVVERGMVSQPTEAMMVAGCNNESMAMRSRTVGWRPTCGCLLPVRYADGSESRELSVPEPYPAVVLDPFAGLCTTGVAALRLGRSFIGVELNQDYAQCAQERLARTTENLPLFSR